MPPRRYLAMEANHRQLSERRPHVAILPWGATEAHGLHLPYGTDVIEATHLAAAAAEKADATDAPVIVLPSVPFGNNEQQLDQVTTISISTGTAAAILRDVVRSLHQQEIRRLVVLNAHGGNEFKPLVRDLQGEFETMLLVVVNFYQLIPEVYVQAFDQPGDHADEMETSLMLHLCPELVDMNWAGTGDHVPFAIESLRQPGVWTPRPWSKCHPDTGSGDPRQASAAKGEHYFDRLTDTIATILVELSDLERPVVAHANQRDWDSAGKPA